MQRGEAGRYLGVPPALQCLDLNGCWQLQTLPSHIPSPCALQQIDLGGCYSLQQLPQDMSYLSKLNSLNLRGCTQLALQLPCPQLEHMAQGWLERQVLIIHSGPVEGGAGPGAAHSLVNHHLRPMMERQGLKVVVSHEQQPKCSGHPAHLAVNSAVVVALLDKQFTSNARCMLLVDLALNTQQPSASSIKPVVIPIPFDEPVVLQESVLPADLSYADYCSGTIPVAVRQKCAATMEAVADLLHHWFFEIGHKLHSAPQDAARDLHVHISSVLDQMFLSSDTDVLGFEHQEEELLAAVQQGQFGLWLHGPGGERVTK